ncbi:hypothetical protein HYALB_00009969 [Hymenoscyphus albidus]|uniref:Pre-mRNA splicing factor CLF1 n=1 Tax=Hymenoscyphus albidus TaxID=595503 RepID=A0A9N9LTX5_9HELO|nr:hypothetical protein HYALB_00009969 [Hymenoscyphus albidus]
MVLPQPVTKLDHSCSVIFKNTLYSYSSNCFQSLPLEKGAQWKKLESGVGVEGGVCVKTTPPENPDAAAMWVVGGSTSDANYQGLQKYTFATSTWETIQPNVPVTQNRLYHGAAYLNGSDSILIYAGSQDGNKVPTSQTFTLNATEPYNVLAYKAIADPAIDPQLIPFSTTKAMYVGGSESNKKMMLFSPSSGWQDSNATLAQPFYNNKSIKSIVINGDDASKTLYTFDMTVSPNVVNRTIFMDSNGNPVQDAQPIVSTREASTPNPKDRRDNLTLEKRDNLTVENWPTYNDTLVPMSTRTDYALARDQSGLVVVSGGNDEDVLCMFRARKNTWVNATSMLVKAEVQQPIGTNPNPPTTISSISNPSGTASPLSTASSEAAPATARPSDPKVPVKILGGVLGSILGVAAIFVLILLLLRYKRKQREHSEMGRHRRSSSGMPDGDEKNEMDFMDRGLPSTATTASARRPYHKQEPSGGSFSSMAILMGKVGHSKGESKDYASESNGPFNKNYAISKPIPHDNAVLSSVKEAPKEYASALPVNDPSRPPLSKARGMNNKVPQGSARRSSGWNRYWSGGSSMNILGFGGASKRTTYEEGSERESSYTEPRKSQFTQSSAKPTPLQVPIPVPGGLELNRVRTGSPTFSTYEPTYPLQREMSGTIERNSLTSSISSYDDRRDEFSSGVPSSVPDQWGPVGGDDYGRAPSVAYTASVYPTSSVYAPTIPRDTIPFPEELRFPEPPNAQRQPTASTDMSWLNLGNDGRV